MRELVIRVVCDACDSNVAEDEATVVKTTIDGQPHEADFCVRCSREWLVPFRPATPTEYVCQTCLKTFKTESGMRRHEKREH